MQYVMIINIGPVQGFIKTARRTRDLWYGSWLLSELSKMAAATVLQEGGRLMLPAVADGEGERLAPGSDLSAVNRVVAIVDRDPNAIGGQIEENLKAFLLHQWEGAKAGIRGPLDTEQQARDQILDLVECTWIAAPYSGDCEGYAAARDAAEEWVAARKNTRDFRAVTWGSPRPKSSLDGQRESVISESYYPTDEDSPDEAKRKAERLFRLFGAGRAERLSGVDLLKRHGRDDYARAEKAQSEDELGSAEKAPSTSDIAARSYLRRLEDKVEVTAPLARKLLDALKTHLRNEQGDLIPTLKPLSDHDQSNVLQGYDGYWLFDNRIRSEAEGGHVSDDGAEKAVAALKGFFSAVEEKLGARGLRPSPYYALLIADGDNMGKVVDAQKTPCDHFAISSALSEYAGEARTIIRDHQGFPIYTGGDDVMALLPLHTLLECAHALTVTFSSRLRGYKGAEGESVTLSSGIVIAHHLEPLSDVIALAEDAEKRAKAIKGKEAVAITISKRSGADRVIAGGWRDGIGERLSFLMGKVVETIPETAAYELLRMARKLSPPQTEDYDANSEVQERKAEQARKDRKQLECVMRMEAMRIFKRKRGSAGTQTIDEVTLDRLDAYLGHGISIEELAHELILARLLYKAKKLAGMPLAIVENEEKFGAEQTEVAQ